MERGRGRGGRGGRPYPHPHRPRGHPRGFHHPSGQHPSTSRNNEQSQTFTSTNQGDFNFSDFSGHFDNAHSSVPHSNPNFSRRNAKPFSPHRFPKNAETQNKKNQNLLDMPKREYRFGFKELTELSVVDGNEILLRFTRQTDKLENTLKNEMSADIIILFMKCISKLCTINFDESKLRMIVKICKSNFISVFEKYILNLPYVKINDKRSNKLFWDDLDDFWRSTFIFYKCVIAIVPSVAVEIFPKLFNINKMTVESLRVNHKENLDPELLEQFDDLQVCLGIAKEEAEQKLVKRKCVDDTEVVPDDFKTKSILPSAEELITKRNVFVRPNIVDGAYENVEHYLDIQFRLMREDFISTMRDSIISFRKDPNQRRYDGGRFYRQVKLHHFAVSKQNVGILVSFKNPNAKINMKFFHKKFLYGSLLCFTNNNFESCFLATVIDRSDELLSKGMILVALEDFKINYEIFENSYTMFESDVFYLQYGPILKALQNFGEKFPMEDCIVKMQISENLPAYVTNGIIIPVEKTMLKVNLEDNIWPSAETLGLDEFQYRAFQMALTREFIAIQGPPGTGKTYIGLKIVETLLQNITKKSPMLILCYTNHALDQFLSGIIKTTHKIVRIGGQSKDEKFASQYNLNTLRRKYQLRNPHAYELNTVISKLKDVQSLLMYFEERDGIIDVSIFEKYLPEHGIDDYLENYSKDDSRSYLVNWLLLTDKPTEILKFSYEQINTCFQNTIDTAKPKDENDDDDTYTTNADARKQLLVDDDDIDEVDIIESILKIKKYSPLELAKYIQNLPKNVNKAYRNYLMSELFYFTDQLNQKWQSVNLSKKFSHILNSKERWMQYEYWCTELKNKLLVLTVKLQEEYDSIMKSFEDFKMINDMEVLQMADVIGVTTTAAARLRPLLLTLSPSIVVIEEAAEVLESHIIVNLGEKCEHVILIGDHQQLRPSTASYRVGKKFNLEISLFERMFKNGKNCSQLGVQHRMRSEFANLIHPSIYPVLENHPSVYEYPDVKGVANNLFFIDHKVFEEKDEDVSSYTNEYEAKFVVLLARYLVQQGYSGSDITILSTYLGQMFLLRNIKKAYSILDDVRISVLDNFQGEENKIILLTLVRSNSENNVGFLNTDNRVCVALSRAKEGFYIIGNMSNLTDKSELWRKVDNTLIRQNSIGKRIPLRCQNHNIITEIETIDDFAKVTEGGCQNQCNVLLGCGHTCQSLCHFSGDDHKSTKCKDKCQRECVLGHKCHLLCFQECRCNVIVEKAFECGHTNLIQCHIEPKVAKCKAKVTYKLPQCSHEKIVFCHETKKYVQCEVPCGERLPCGHACIKNCHKDNDPEHLDYRCLEQCSRKNKKCSEDHQCQKLCFQDCDLCSILVKKKRNNCSHPQNVPCYDDINLIPCKKKCSRSMACGHFCHKMCFEPCSGCLVQVEKLRKCGHKIFVECSVDVDLKQCTQRCNLNLPCGHRCWNKCNEVCGKKPCQEMVPNPYQSLCGHAYNIKCKDSHLAGELGSFLTIEYCKQPCGKILDGCEHICKGTCGQCRGRLHIPCTEPCGNRLICGHICKDPCREYCSTCRENCDTQCKHSKCPTFCGYPCKLCTHKCDQGCPHSKCTKKCGEFCDRDPCSEPCIKMMNCGHRCHGLCGEVCPPICKACKPEEIPEILFGAEDDDDARFLKLIDCNHIVEVGGMDEWVNNDKNSEEIKYPRCPLCNTFIKKTPRYYNEIKQTFNDIQKVKRKNFGDLTYIKNSFEQFYTKFEKLDKTSNFSTVAMWKQLMTKIINDSLIQNYKKDMQKPDRWNKKNIQLSKVEIDNFNLKLDVLIHLNDIFTKNEFKIQSSALNNQVNFILKSIFDTNRKITQERVNNFKNELARVENMVNLEKTEQRFLSYLRCPENINHYRRLLDIIFSNQVFDSNVQKEVKKLFSCLPRVEFVSAQEKAMIVQAVGLKQGHWFKCPNGHLYCIGECGGAMQIGECPECKCKIGGTNHALTSGNSLAPEMDGARYAAYSDIANENYMLRHMNFN